MYATAFSGFYWAMLIVLFVLIFRPVAFDYRSKVPSTKWRTNWDWLLFLGSAVPPIIFGVAFGNLLQGVPFEIDATMRPVYTGSFFGLLNPFGLLCGVLSLAMIVAHGANYLVLRTEGTLQAKARKVGSASALLAFALFLLGGVWVYLGIDGYVAVSGLDPAGPANPLAKTVEIREGAWFANYGACRFSGRFRRSASSARSLHPSSSARVRRARRSSLRALRCSASSSPRSAPCSPS
jgi:cytochrome d ubiquinol oxidase subunit II